MMNRPVNLLLTSVGTQCYLVDAFRDALGDDGTLVTADASRYAPALYAADIRYTLPPAEEVGYLDGLLNIVRRHDIRWLISLNEQEIRFLEVNDDQLRDADVDRLGPRGDGLRACLDKVEGQRLLRRIGVDTPTSIVGRDAILGSLNSGKLPLPAVGKYRSGRGSVGQMDLRSQEAIRCWLQAPSNAARPDDLMVQPLLQGTEYGLDLVNDLHGQPAAVLVRQKHLMRNGETAAATTVHDSRFEALGTDVAAAIGHRGVVDCDLLLTDHGPTVLDLNPRFGGGYPFNHLAGANVPAAMVGWMRDDGATSHLLEYRAGVTAARVSEPRIISDEVG